MKGLLEQNIHLVIECAFPECRHRVRWRAVEAVERLGPDCTIEQAKRRLKCGRCGRLGRDKWLSVHPCTLDQGAASARWQHARGLESGNPVAWDLEESLAMYRQLLGGGELGGDGPVQWPVDGPSNDA
jgi:hypothetical protein